MKRWKILWEYGDKDSSSFKFLFSHSFNPTPDPDFHPLFVLSHGVMCDIILKKNDYKILL